MAGNAQTFWLKYLGQADQYNEWVFSQISPHLGYDVLEIGCGIGNFTALLAEKCRQVVAVDIDKEYVSAAQRRFSGTPSIEVHQKDATQEQWEGCFDTVVMLDVLEHIDDDIGVLRLIAKSLKPGGNLVIKVPALQSLYCPMDKAIGHYRRYDRESLHDTLSRGGFETHSLWFFNLLGMMGWWVNGKLLKRTIPSAGEVGLFNTLVNVLRPLEAALKFPIGLSLFAVGTKK